MKKFSTCVLSGMLLLCAVGITACGSEHTHSYSEKSKVGASCTEGAYVLMECECGESYKEYDKKSEPLGHNFGEYESDGNRTCTQDGTKTAKCTRCNETDTIADEARGHIVYDYEDNNDGTCTEEGTKTGKCIICNEDVVLPASALGHSFVNYVSDNNATCSAYGTKTAKCERCEETDTVTDIASKLPHSFQNGVCTECDAKENISLEYRLIGNEYCVIGIGTVKDADITIPEEYQGKPVTSIAAGAFSGCSNVTSIFVPDSITSIGSSAFYGCALKQTESEEGTYLELSGNPYFLLYKGKEVQSCTVHEGTKFIASKAFEYNDELTSIVFPDSVVGIGDSAFNSCDNLSAVTFGSSLRTIGQKAFSDCSSLTSMPVPEGVTEIQQGAFSYCSALTNITLPNSLTKLGDFVLPTNLSKINLNSYNNAQYLGNESNPYLVLVQASNSNITSCTVHANTKFIYSTAFYGSKLTSITIPDGVTCIGAMAFERCENLTSVTFGKNLKSIGANAFGSCEKLKSVKLPDSLTELGSYAFYDCRALTSVTLSKNLTVISGYAFKSCYSLTSITIPEGVTQIGSGAFEDCDELKTVTIPSSVVFVGEDVFSGCDKLKYTAYDTGLYLGNTSNPYMVLVAVKINTVTSCDVHKDTKIIAGAFSSCRDLEKITLRAGVTLITDGTFTYCYKLKSIEFQGTIEEWENMNNYSDGWDFWYYLKGCIVQCSDGKILVEEK